MLPVAYYLYVRKADSGYLTAQGLSGDREAIRQWLIASFLKPSGIWGSGLDTLLTALREVIRSNHARFPTDAVRDEMRSRGKSLAFNADEVDDLTELRCGDKRTFALLSLAFPHLDLRQHFHIDHVCPKSRFTPAKLGASGFDTAQAERLRDSADRLPNLQLLEGHENLHKRATWPTEWLQTFDSDDVRTNYVTTHLLDEVADGIEGFETFYEARRQRLKSRITGLLGVPQDEAARGSA